MSDYYGVTPNGFVRKRYDTIYSEIQADIKNETGIDISVNPQSYINVLVSSITDKLTALHELAEAVYYAHYPSTADGYNLDYAVQFGGLSREEAASTKYYLLCTGDDGTMIDTTTRVASTTTPAVYFTASNISYISSSNFNKATVCLLELEGDTDYSGVTFQITVDGVSALYSYADGDDASAIMNGLKSALDSSGLENFTFSVDGDNLVIEANNAYSNYVLSFDEYLTTVNVSSVILFESEELTKLKLAEGTITNIISNTEGFDSCTNLAIPIYGRERETDAELRLSYISKQAYRSSSMISSITSAIIANVDDVTSAYGFENDSDEYDGGYETDDDGDYVYDSNGNKIGIGRPPHSIEIIVDGGSDADIAQQILYYKAAGIQTCSTSSNPVTVDVPTEYNSTVSITFSRPTTLYVWLLVTITKNPKESMPNNYEELVNDAITDYTDSLTGGENIVLQKMISSILTAVSGIAYLTIMGYSSVSAAEPSDDSDYDLTYITVSELQKASFSTDRISINVV